MLSVSSDGSCGMLPLEAKGWRVEVDFQYPRTDRVECYRIGGWGSYPRSSFSILGRIVWNATWPAGCYVLCHDCFQYPRTDRVECYSAYRRRRSTDCRFQYPRTDRVECYFLAKTQERPSILLSVSSDGSCGMLLFFRLNQHRKDPTFQYPRTDRVECYLRRVTRLGGEVQTFSILGRIVWNATPNASSIASRAGSLSVSSDGSCGMLHHTQPLW